MKDNVPVRVKKISETSICIKEVKFEGDTIIGIKHEKTGNIYIGVRWVCRAIGLTDGQANQKAKAIQTDEFLREGLRMIDLSPNTQRESNSTRIINPSDNKKRVVICLNVKYLTMWLAKINVTAAMKRNTPYAARKLLAYQLKAADVLNKAFLINHAIPGTYGEALLEAGRLAIENEKLASENKKMLPKTKVYDHIMAGNKAVTMKEAADILGYQNMGQNNLFKFLRKKKILTQKNLPYRHYRDDGYFDVIDSYNSNNGIAYSQTLVFPKGLVYIRSLLDQAGYERLEK